MDSGHFKLVVTLILAGRVWSLPVGCRYNETAYLEGEVVQVTEPCLSCVCRRGGLACNLQVCADYSETLPAGCFFIYKTDACCPQLLCEDGFIPNGIELRTAIEMGNKVDENGCLLNGTIYGKGSAVASRDPCEYCYCAEGGLRCVRPRCTRAFEGCTAVYEKSSCCPTRFDCRDAKVSFLTSPVPHFGNNSESHKAPFEDSQGDETSETLKEKTTEGLVAAPTDATTTERSVLDARLETTTSLSADCPTTLSFQTIETGTTAKKLSGAGVTEEMTAQVASEAFAVAEALGGTEDEAESRRKEEGDQMSGDGVRSPAEEPELSGSPWNASHLSDDYDSYDYAEPKLPPSLPNLVIFPFVAADAVVKDESAELYKETQIERNDGRPVTYMDYFSPPTKTEGGFVPKQPSLDPFYELPFSTETPKGLPAEEKRTAPQASVTHRTHNEPSFFFDEGEEAEFTSEGINLKQLESPSGSLKGMVHPEVAPELFGTKPVTVAHKNIIVDFYPDRQVTTARGHSTIRPAENSATEKSLLISPSTSAPSNMTPESTSDLFEKNDFSDKPTEERVLEEKIFSIAEGATPTAATKESLIFENFLKTILSETSTSAFTAFTTSANEKYSSKINGTINTTAKFKRENGTAKADLEIADSEISLADAHLFPNFVTESGRPLSLDPTPVESSEMLDRQLNDSAHSFDGAFAGAPAGTNSPPGTLLKLAGCNIYGMMYRIGKIIAELSGPCMECLCTDLGVQCNSLRC